MSDFNPVVILTRNCLELTKKCVESVRKQDVETYIHIFDNGSTDGTVKWLEQAWNAPNYQFTWFVDVENRGVSFGWNLILGQLFDPKNAFDVEHVLVLNNDVVIAGGFYSKLLSYDVAFVSGVSTDSMFDLGPLVVHDDLPLSEGPDFSGFLIRRVAWEKIGPFDERMKLYASDNDYHVRAHRLGIPLLRANVPFYHERSSTLKKASPEEKRKIELQADADRAVFKSIYGCEPWEPGYAELLK